MALIKCDECEKDKSEFAVTCPHCGIGFFYGSQSGGFLWWRRLWYGPYGECINHKPRSDSDKKTHYLSLPELIVLMRADIYRLKCIGIVIVIVTWLAVGQ